MSLIIPSSQTLVASGYDIPYSCRFDKASSAKMTRTFNHSTSYTTSCWVKRSNQVGTVSGLQYVYRFGAEDHMGFGTTDKLQCERYTGINAYTSRHMRDSSAWYHIVVKASTNNFEVFVNGVAHDKTDGGTYGNNTGSGTARTSQAFNLGAHESGSTQYFDGYIADFHFCDGMALDPTSFGEFGDTYGEWKPIEYENDGATSHGSNGWHLDFADSAALGNDVSGNNNDLTPSNIASHDQMLDTPTNNFCTAQVHDRAGGSYVFKQGNLHVTRSGGDGFIGGTIGVNSGKWYFELLMQSGVSNYPRVGIWDRENGQDAQVINYPNEVDGTTASRSWGANGSRHGPGLASGSAPTYGNGDILQFAIDVDNQKLHFGKNNTWYSTGTTTVTSAAIADNSAAGTFTDLTAGSTWEPCIFSNNSADDWFCNFGADATFAGLDPTASAGPYDDGDYGSFYYQPPSGFKAICTKNLPDPTVVPADYFSVLLWSGNNARTISTVGFEPDLVWFKCRSSGNSHELVDTLRGATKRLRPEDNSAEATESAGLTSFTSTGYVLGSDNGYNASGQTYVSWNWKAGTDQGSTATTGSGTAKTYTASYSVGAGFSMIKYTGNGTAGHTIPHHLGSKPDLVICKQLTANNWQVGFVSTNASMTNGQNLWLDTSSAQSTDANSWNNTSPNATNFTLGANGAGNHNDVGYMAYCFRSIDGYSKIGHYYGSGTATHGCFMYTGFKPQWILIKGINRTSNWSMYDSTRSGTTVGGVPTTKRNELALGFQADASTAETSTHNLDFLSNGFKLYSTDGEINTGNGIYLFYAIGDMPFKLTTAQ